MSRGADATVDPLTDPAKARMIRRRLVQSVPQEGSKGRAVPASPRNPPLRIDPLEATRHQHAEANPRRNPTTAHLLRMELGAPRLHETVEVVFLQDLVQLSVERMPRALRRVLSGDRQGRSAPSNAVQVSSSRSWRNILRVDPIGNGFPRVFQRAVINDQLKTANN